jgi:hypothetical protein
MRPHLSNGALTRGSRLQANRRRHRRNQDDADAAACLPFHLCRISRSRMRMLRQYWILASGADCDSNNRPRSHCKDEARWPYRRQATITDRRAGRRRNHQCAPHLFLRRPGNPNRPGASPGPLREGSLESRLQKNDHARDHKIRNYLRKNAVTGESKSPTRTQVRAAHGHAHRAATSVLF